MLKGIKHKRNSLISSHFFTMTQNSHLNEQQRRILEDFPIDLLLFPAVLFFLQFFPLTQILYFCFSLFLLALVFCFFKGLPKQGILSSSVHVFLPFCIQSLISFFSKGELTLFHQELIWITSFLVFSLSLRLLDYLISLQGKKEKGSCCAYCKSMFLHQKYYRKRLNILAIIFIVLLLTSRYLIDSSLIEDYLLLSISIISAIILLIQSVHIYWLHFCLFEEKLIPILNERNETIQVVPLSEIEQVKEGIIPVVRLIVFSQGLIYLEQKYKDSKQYDTPFTCYQKSGSKPQEHAQQMIDQRFCGLKRLRPKTLINYRFTIGNQKQLIYLFVAELSCPDLLHIDCQPIEGKWWHLNHLDIEQNHQLLSLELQEELPYLKETVLLAQKLVNKKQ